MNKRMISFILGTLLILEAVILLLPALVALIYAERAGWYYLFTALGAALAGLALRLISRPTRKTIYARDGLLCVALGWVVGRSAAVHALRRYPVVSGRRF